MGRLLPLLSSQSHRAVQQLCPFAPPPTTTLKTPPLPPATTHPPGLFGVYAVAKAGSDHEDLAWSIMHELTRMCYTVR